MKDRSVQYPKRYRLTKIPGTDDIYDLDPAPGEITEEGTLINKGTLLSDDTAAKFFESLVGTETVDQVLGWIGNYNLHWWRRRIFIENTGYAEKKTDVYTRTNGALVFNFERATVSYSEEISISDAGAVSLLNPQQCNTNSYSSPDVLKGKYIQGIKRCDGWNGWNGAGGFPEAGNLMNAIFYISPTAIFGNGSSYDERNYWWIDPRYNAGWMYLIGSQYYDTPFIGEWEYLKSPDRSVYPENGKHDGYEYQYLGIPFDNAVTAPKIATGEYTGTGTYGSANPNTLTFDFEPKLVIILCDDYRMIGSFLGIYIHGTNYMTSGLGTYSSNGANPVSTNGMSISWYGDDADRQFNRSNTIYKYIALG